MNIEKLLNKYNLKVARVNAGLDTKRATKKISQSKSDLVLEWENGTSVPTWIQLNNLSKVYGISTLLLFSNEELTAHKLITDYRSKKKGVGDDNVNLLVNLVISRQKWISEQMKNAGGSTNKLQGSGGHLKTPKELSEYIKKSLNISVSDIKLIPGRSTDSKRNALKYLINKAEVQGIFVGKTLAQHRITVDQMRGMFISNDHSPFIVLNRKDAPAAQLFTFIHELAHLYRKTDGISNSLDFRNIEKDIDPEEVFCNRVAAELLLPREDFENSFYTKEDIIEIADLYKVSNIFVFYRLKDLNLIRDFEADDLENEILQETKNNVALKNDKKSTGGSHTNNMKDSNGSLFNKVISNAYFENKIGYVEATKLLRFSPESV